MKEIGFKLKNLSKEDYYRKHLEIINPFLPVPLTEKKINVLAAFMSLEGDIVKDDRFSTSARKLVRKKHSLSHGNLGNYLKDYKEKNLIYIPEGKTGYEIRPYLFPEMVIQGYKFQITRDV
jgi:hypothetical protein